MRNNIKLDRTPWWASRVIWGFDGDEGEQGNTDADGSDSGEGQQKTEQETEQDSVANLKSALQKERLRAKNLERKLAAASKAPEGDEGDQDDFEEGSGKGKEGVGSKGRPRSAARSDSAASKQLEKLTAAFRQASLDKRVAELAKDFYDPTDVSAAIDQRLLTYTQDDDDPTNVVWDDAEIKSVIADLRKTKPHLVKPKEGTPQRPSGSKFGGRPGGGKDQTEAQKAAALAARIPALRGAMQQRTSNT